MSKLLIFIGLVAVLIALSVFLPQQQKLTFSKQEIDKFQNWMQRQNRNYGDSDYVVYRMGVFTENMKILENFMQNNKDSDLQLGETQFMDITQDEFIAQYLGTQQKDNDVNYIAATPNTTVNWVSKGAVTPVKNQGQCGSCWAFSTTGCLEGVSFIESSQGLQSFSEQQLVDCSTSYGNEGCNGGLMDYGFDFVKDNGITLEKTYPYVGVDQTCKVKGGNFTITGYTDVPSGNCDALVDAVTKQPVSVAVDAQTWQFYVGGVFPAWACGKSLDHGVLAVGYTPTNWIVKNSWGASWGESGYIRLAMGNTCGICNQASWATY